MFEFYFQKTAELAKMNTGEREAYFASQKATRDNKNTWDYAIDEAKIEGKIEGIEIGKSRNAVMDL
jgi:hypothetical protein